MIRAVRLDSTVLLHSWRGVAVGHPKPHPPRTTESPPKECSVSGRGGDVGGSFPDLNLTAVCSSSNPWPWVGRGCIFRLLLRPRGGEGPEMGPRGGEGSPLAEPRPRHCRRRGRPAVLSLSILGPRLLQPALSPSRPSQSATLLISLYFPQQDYHPKGNNTPSPSGPGRPGARGPPRGRCEPQWRPHPPRQARALVLFFCKSTF